MRRLKSLMRSRWKACALGAALPAASVVLSALGPLNWVAPLVARTEDRILTFTAHHGAALRQITLSGRKRTSTADILTAVDLGREAPLWDFDPAAASARLEALPWVKSVRVERRFPDTIHIAMAERTPIAIWETGGTFTLVDAEGTPIVPFSAEFARLPVITGEGAPRAAADLLTLLAAEPDIARRVKAARRMSRRRWDLFIDALGDNGVVARLPEIGAAEALSRLAALERTQGLLNRDLSMIDMRLNDRVVVRVNARACDGSIVPPAAPPQSTRRRRLADPAPPRREERDV